MYAKAYIFLSKAEKKYQRDNAYMSQINANKNASILKYLTNKQMNSNE